MTLAAQTILAVPPFPGGKPYPVVLSAAEDESHVRSATAEQILAALRQHRVGGPFWAPDDPWTIAQESVTGSADDPLMLLSAIAGKRVRLNGEGTFAALADRAPGAPETEAIIAALVERHLVQNVAYADPFTGQPTSALDLIETLASWRRLIDANRPIAAAFGFAHWKRDTVDPLLWAGSAVPFRPANPAALRDLKSSDAIAVWKARVPPALLAEIEAGPWPVMEVEDGFIRSAGLGADCVPPLSIIVDDLGVHYDPTRPNRLEEMLAQGTPSPDMLARARRLREWLVREAVSKYGIGRAATLPRRGGQKRHLLAVGQVEDDRSVQFGGGAVQSNLELLRRVRAGAPDAWIVYRPHPDVEAGHRRGAIPTNIALELANEIDPGSPISALIAMADEVHVITSLAGFEALLHGTSVTTHGMPFFAGWGLTNDLGPSLPRRNRALTLDALTAHVLIQYPRYLDPVTNLPCTAEILVMRLISGVQRQNVALVPLRKLVGLARRAIAHMLGNR
ncbi:MULTISPECIES: hypothetical protein [unclassified Sphingobium]|uniref:capsular polysaccharide export protein, LipB/KpsS family n=1 Tax=unclassified Sphingobium TaxID=2611147 RepID=UPI002223EF4C|nr:MULTISPECIES: hypothetical protein [unclassified Sphingobium]MCW2394178.1 capsular polysaccharide export protein [Sphingobium sp. B8D3B]MCW2417692.1 capsular polysaccharide export protein [Sphingobium sp. B8D3C]